jgi:4-hydroxy-3-methylbut-2-en-1-yl diphosphate reductase
VAVTAGASAPENLVQELVASLQRQGLQRLKEIQVQDEDVRFSLPPELIRLSAGPAAPLP